MNEKNQVTTYTVKVPVGKAGQRLDSFLADSLNNISRTRLKVLIDEGTVILEQDVPDGGVLDPSQKVLEDQVFLIKIPPLVSATPKAQSIPLDIVYEDNNILVIILILFQLILIVIQLIGLTNSSDVLYTLT